MMACQDFASRAVVIGAGFCGLTAAYELAKRGVPVTVLEQDTDIGGLAGSFVVNSVRLEKFYHHWFTSDHYIFDLIEELGASDAVVRRSTRTGMFYANDVYRLSSPRDVLRFTPLPLMDRVRLGLLALRARRISDWRQLEHLSAAQWLRSTTGDRVYSVVWEPLLRGKFGPYAEDVSAVWFWNKLKLRGGSRKKGGGEQLAYYQGGFAALAERLASGIRAQGGEIRTGYHVRELITQDGRCVGVRAKNETFPASNVVATTPLPTIADLVANHCSEHYVMGLRRIKYLANLCLVLELNKPLSETYWLNVNDPTFPFVGVIEHTNFEPATTYSGRHIVYLSKYLPESDAYFQLSDAEVLAYTLPHLQRMFPALNREWICEYHVWRSKHAQPVVERHYSKLIPSYTTPLRGLHIASMAQIYPEDRGTNYAVREGKHVAELVVNDRESNERYA